MVIREQTRREIAAAMSRYPEPRGALLTALHLVQQDHGYFDAELVSDVANVFELPRVEIYEVLSFYNMFHTAPQGRHQVRVCTNLPCSLLGSRVLLAQLESHLGIRAGDTTPDGRLTLGHEECLGACGYGPMMRVDDTYHENLDLVRACEILDSLDSPPPSSSSVSPSSPDSPSSPG
jgi:NADH-quinone oxidoreductase subunit E